MSPLFKDNAVDISRLRGFRLAQKSPGNIAQQRTNGTCFFVVVEMQVYFTNTHRHYSQNRNNKAAAAQSARLRHRGIKYIEDPSYIRECTSIYEYEYIDISKHLN